MSKRQSSSPLTSDSPVCLLVMHADKPDMHRTCVALARPGVRLALYAEKENGHLLSCAAKASEKGAIVLLLHEAGNDLEKLLRRVEEDFGRVDGVLSPADDKTSNPAC